MLKICKKWNCGKHDFKENEPVIMKNEHQYRSSWSVGRIISVDKEVDGKFRSEQVPLVCVQTFFYFIIVLFT